MPDARLVVVDLEGTCWEPDEHPALAANQANEAEVIELGAVPFEPMAPAVHETGAPFRAVVRPRRHPTLSAFCTRLTGLTQAEVSAGRAFPDALAAFVAWAGGEENLVLASWGAWDDRQLRRDARRHGLPEPRWTPLNIKRQFSRRAKARGAPRGGWLSLADSLAWLGLGFEGQQHRAVDDARNAARVLAWVYEDLASADRKQRAAATPQP